MIDVIWKCFVGKAPSNRSNFQMLNSFCFPLLFVVWYSCKSRMEINLNCNYLFELLFLHWLTLFKDWVVVSKPPRTQHCYFQSRRIQTVLMTWQVFSQKKNGEKCNKKENKLFSILTELPNTELTQCYRKVHFAFSCRGGIGNSLFIIQKKQVLLLVQCFLLITKHFLHVFSPFSFHCISLTIRSWCTLCP